MGGVRCRVCPKSSKNAIISVPEHADIKPTEVIFQDSRRISRKLKRKHSNLSQDYNTCQTTTPSRPYNLRSQSAKRLNCAEEESCSMQQVSVDQCYVAPDVVVNSTSRKPSASTRSKTPPVQQPFSSQSGKSIVCFDGCPDFKPTSSLDYDWIQVADCELESDIHLLLKAHDMVKIDNQWECHSNLARPTFYNCLFEKTKGCRFQMYLCYENGRWKLFRKKGSPWHRHACDKLQPGIDPQASQLVPYSKPKKKLPRLDLKIWKDELGSSNCPNADIVWLYRSLDEHNHVVKDVLCTAIPSVNYRCDFPENAPVVADTQVTAVPPRVVSQEIQLPISQPIKIPVPGFDLLDDTLTERIKHLAEDLTLELDIVGTNFYFKRGNSHVALQDLHYGGAVMVQTIEDDGIVLREQWIKGDFDQYLCAIRGKCMENFFLSQREERLTAGSEDTPMPVIEIGDEEEELDTQGGPFTLTNGTRNEVFSMAAYNMLLQFANLDRGIQFSREQQTQPLREELLFLDEPTNSVQVVHKVDGIIASVKRWLKADWSQFVCAVRGKCINHFYGSPLECLKKEWNWRIETEHGGRMCQKKLKD
uniref:Uncharacterized protein n=1 Tax=Ditylenchus dipsaci TaxID=166011 RepID=A0A915D842_9BILA